ncbi:MAG TPA: TMEM175 family protein [Caulobacteraceae bacterium]|nr:TMEM175 family protein [Caulobacteraceae bacterium]
MSDELGPVEPIADEAARRQEHWYARLMSLTDAVFAIAITLQATAISLPPRWAGDWPTLWSTLAPQLNAFAVSFVVISVFWLAHRRFMAQIDHVDPPLSVLTLAFLGFVALQPLGTRMMSLHGDMPAARLAYGALLVGIGAALATLWGYAALIAGLVKGELSLRLRWLILLLILLTPPWFLFLATLIPPPAPPFAVPALLLLLFLVGWRLRLWIGRLLGGEHHTA